MMIRIIALIDILLDMQWFKQLKSVIDNYALKLISVFQIPRPYIENDAARYGFFWAQILIL